MEKMRSTFLLYPLFFAGLLLTSLAAAELNEMTKTKINDNFIKLHEKFDSITDRVDQLENNSPLGPDFVKDWNEIKANMTQIMLSNDKLHKKTDEISKIKELLLELIETVQDQKMNKRETTNDVVREMTSECTSFCESKVKIWANESNSKFKGDLKRMDFSLQNSPFNTSNTCHPNPCSNGGECEPTTYHCTNCPFLTSGRHCENLNCNKANKCFQYHSNMYVVFEENVDWNAAYNRCIRAGMHLAQLKDGDTNEAVVSQLKIMYEPSRHLYFWIGLKNNNGSEWLWVDGTPLGTYTGGFFNFKGQLGESWGIVYLHSASGVTWHPRLAANVPQSAHYPLCEKRIHSRY